MRNATATALSPAACWLACCWLAVAAQAASAQAAGLAGIERLIGEARCSDDRQCRVIGIGARACGGPAGYRAWSSLQTDAPALVALVAADAAEQRLAQQRDGIASTCSVVPVPAVACRVPPAAGPAAGGALPGRCTLMPAAAGS